MTTPIKPPAEGDFVDIYGVRWSRWAAQLSARLDIVISVIIVLAITAAFHLHFQLLAGDWDFWVDWKDRQYWVTLTPIVAITFPAALQYVLWEKFRLPLGATLAITCLMLGAWIARVFGFHLWSYFPFSLIWPVLMIPGALVLDCVLLLTGNFFFTAVIGGMGFAVLFYPSNWPMLAAYRLPVEIMGTLVSVGDYIGYTFTRTATPEYLRFIERGTLRTFGGHSAWVASAFSGFVCVMTYLLWWHIGMLLSRVTTLPNRWRSIFGMAPEHTAATAPVESHDAR
jgi:methane/ammonia monooxygenase subunit A